MNDCLAARLRDTALQDLKLDKFAAVISALPGCAQWSRIIQMHDTLEGTAACSAALHKSGATSSELQRLQDRVGSDVRASVARVLILGAGPMGLLAAVEMALLGHHVSVVEGRDKLNRLNVLKLWGEARHVAITSQSHSNHIAITPSSCGGRHAT